MKKIMFNDRYGLTQAVIEGRKTVTRRIVSDKLWDRWTDYDDFCNSVSCGPSTPVVRQYYNEFEFFTRRKIREDDTKTKQAIQSNGLYASPNSERISDHITITEKQHEGLGA